MNAELPKPQEFENYHWLVMDPRRGAPLKCALPLFDPTIPLGFKERGSALPFSRWTLGRKNNPSFSNTGSGLEGHLCSLDMLLIKDFLNKFQNDALYMIKHDVGLRPLDKFLQDPTESIGLKFLIAMKTAFDVTLAKARAVRSMVNKGGYVYSPQGDFIDMKPRPDRIERSRSYESFIYTSPQVMDWQITPVDSGILSLDHNLRDLQTKMPIAVENLGGDIGYDPRFKLLAEIGRFGHPIIPKILETL